MKNVGTYQEFGNLVIYSVDPKNPPPLTQEQKEELAGLAGMPDSEIDFSDIPELGEWPKRMVDVSGIKIDAEVLRWILKQVGSACWQDKLNAMLRRAMQEERAESERSAASEAAANPI